MLVKPEWWGASSLRSKLAAAHLLSIVELCVFGVEQVEAPAVQLQSRHLMQDRMKLAVGCRAQLPHLHLVHSVGEKLLVQAQWQPLLEVAWSPVSAFAQPP